MNELLNSVTESDYNAVAKTDWPSYNQATSMVELPSKVKTRIELMLTDYRAKQEKVKHFCTFAFYGAEYVSSNQTNTLKCCNNPKDMTAIRQAFLSQQKPTDCELCWSFEDNGEKSLRQLMNTTLDRLLDKDITTMYEDIYEESINGSHDALIYKIKPSNLCNATCVTCGSDFSSAWEQLEKKNGETPGKRIRWIANEHGLTDGDNLYPINYKTAKVINFVGGEPTLEKNNFLVLEYLAAAGNFNCLISFTTHGNFKFTTQQEKLLKSFNHLQFNFSIDGVGPVYEYLRYPLSWQRINDNLQWCRDNQFEISVTLTVSNLNLYYLDQTIDWLNSQNLNYSLNKASDLKVGVHWRRHYCGDSLSRSVKDALKKHTSNQCGLSMLDPPHTEKTDYWYEQFLLDIIKQDRWKGIKIQDYLGEFAKIIQHDLDRLSNNRVIPIQVL